MSRRIDLEDDALVVRYSGLDLSTTGRAVVLDLTGNRFRRVFLTVDEPEAFAQRVRERA